MPEDVRPPFLSGGFPLNFLTDFGDEDGHSLLLFREVMAGGGRGPAPHWVVRAGLA